MTCRPASHRAAASTSAAFRLLLDGLARLHGRHWEQGLGSRRSCRVLTLDQHTAMFTDPCAAAGGRIEPTGWVAEVLDKVFLFRTYVPVLLDALGSADADFYLDLCQHRERWLAPLSRLPQTLIHGDIRRANVAALAVGRHLAVRLGLRVPGAGCRRSRLVLVPAFLVLSAARRACAGGSRAAQGLLRTAA